jgi:hypothetical protein
VRVESVPGDTLFTIALPAAPTPGHSAGTAAAHA